MHQNPFGGQAPPESYRAPPDPLARFRGRETLRMSWEGDGEKRRGGKGREKMGRGSIPAILVSHSKR